MLSGHSWIEGGITEGGVSPLLQVCNACPVLATNSGEQAVTEGDTAQACSPCQEDITAAFCCFAWHLQLPKGMELH